MSLLMTGVQFRYHPEIRGTIGSGFTTATSYVVTPTAAVQEGNLMVVCVLGSEDRVVTPPAGWTLVVQSITGPTNEIYTKVATGAEPADYTFSFSASLNGGWTFFELLRAETMYTKVEYSDSQELSSVSSVAMNYSVFTPAIVITNLAITSTFTSSIDNSFVAVGLGGRAKIAYKRYLLPLGGETTNWTIGGTVVDATTTIAVIHGRLIQ